MTDSNYFRQQLTEAETALKNRNVQKLELEKEIAGIEYIIQVCKEILYNRPQDASDFQDQDTNRPANTRRLGSRTDRRVTAIREILTEHSSLHKSIIVKDLQGRGLVGADEKKASNIVSGVLSSSKEFVRIGKGIWSLAHSDTLEETMTTV